MKPTYLFIPEQGENPFYIEGDITPHDRKTVEVGIAQIIRLADMHTLQQNNTWEPIPKGKLNHAPEIKDLGPFHTL